MRNDFFILSFFVGYILSFDLVRLRTIRLSARSGAHIECRCSVPCTEDVTITNVIIKTPDRKYDWGCEWRHARRQWAENFGDFWKKQLVEIRSWARLVDFWAQARPGQFVAYGMHRAFVGSDGTVSRVKIVSPSPRVVFTFALFFLSLSLWTYEQDLALNSSQGLICHKILSTNFYKSYIIMPVV